MKNMLIGLTVVLSMATVTNVSERKIEPPNPIIRTCEEQILYRLNYYSKLLVKFEIPYVWGGYWGILGGDCSGQMRAIFRYAGLPFPRTTSYRMWLDKGGWPGERIFVKLDEHDLAEFPNLLFWTYSKKRPFGHVALTVWNATDIKGNRVILFREASFSKKIFKETVMKKGDGRWGKLVGILILDLTPGFDCVGDNNG